MPKKSYAEDARTLIAKITGKATPLKALLYLAQLVDGPEKFVKLVERAMFQAADAEMKNIKQKQKETKDG